MSERFSEQTLPVWRRAVLKVGSNLLTAGGRELSPQHARGLADFVVASRAAGRQVVIVSSGAVAAGRPRVKEDLGGLVARQALAALGQTRMVALWQELLGATPVAQVLLAHDDLRNRRRYLNARNTLLELLRLDAVPVINENDTVAVEELKLGDNDNLAAIVAALVDADLLLIASDVDGLYDAHPQLNPQAKPVETVAAVVPEILAMAGAAGSAHGTGGMHTKLEAAAKAAKAGITTVLFNGTNAETVALLGAGAFRGTRFGAASSRLAARKYWLRHAPGSDGRLRVDDGAMRAVVAGKSLLPGGIVAVDGEFARGDIVEIVCDGNAIARGLVQYNAGEVRRLAGKQSRDIEATLGFSYGDTVMRRDDLVILSDGVTA
ncbi:MAG: glutamate 5-kinase [Rudaea sp.]|uniref:glutamate 5-kinase n=1 Tax=unclassified Rudaea TaxID=2627037 RepID=UPI0010F87DDE|nr:MULTISPECIES: glutamate 5-kinase [unclassified Rudaea]MBN8884150.1 glutamate 5-kinase [Rudaea sp.]